MTQRFILDENIALLAQTLENDHGETDVTCRRLLNDIIEICHSIVFDVTLWGKFHQKLQSLPPDQPFGPRSILRLLYLAMQRDEKIHNIGVESPSFPEEGTIPSGSQDDVPMVRLAVETGAILVTTDGPLRESLESTGIQEKYSLQVLSPDEALQIL